MRQTVLLAQLYKASEPEYIMGTCHIADKEDEDRFECKIKGDKKYKEQLWHYVTGQWDGMTAEIEFTDVNSRGIPTDAVIVKVQGKSSPYFRTVDF